MKKIFALLCLIFVLISCGKESETVVESQSGTIVDDVVNVNTPTNPEDPQDDFLTENPVVEVATYSEVQNNNATSRFALKNDMVFWKDTIESIVTKCQYFEWEIDYVVEQWEKIPTPEFTLKNYFYDAVENDYCPGTESKEEKYVMVDMLIEWVLPEKFLNFEWIEDLEDVSFEDLKIDPTDNIQARIWMISLFAIFMALEEDQDKFDNYVEIHDEYAKKTYELSGVGSEEIYYNILMANAYRNGDCKSYIEKNLISY